MTTVLSAPKTESDMVTIVKFFADTKESKLGIGREVKALPETDRAQLAEGIRNSTLTY